MEGDLNSHPARKLTEPTKAQLDALSPRKQQIAQRERFVCPLCEQIPEKIRPLVEKGQKNTIDMDAFLIDHIANHIKSLSCYPSHVSTMMPYLLVPTKSQSQ